MQQTPTSPAGLTALEKVIAFVDELVLELRGRRVSPSDDGEMLHNE